jgi:hypothetical protein
MFLFVGADRRMLGVLFFRKHFTAWHHVLSAILLTGIVVIIMVGQKNESKHFPRATREEVIV